MLCLAEFEASMMQRLDEFEAAFTEQLHAMERSLKRWMIGQTAVIVTLLGALELAR